MDQISTVVNDLISHFGKFEGRYDDAFILGTTTSSSKKGRWAFLVDREEDVIYGSGSNANGVLATGDTQDIKDGFKKIPNLCEKGIIAFAVGDRHMLALSLDGHVWSWGRNEYGPWRYLIFVSFPN